MHCNASAEEIMKADSCTCTLKLSNQKNRWMGVCINHQVNGDPVLCPVKALTQRYSHIKANKHKPDTFLLTCWERGKRHDVTDGDIRTALKFAAVILDYPEMKGIPIDRIGTHSLRGRGRMPYPSLATSIERFKNWDAGKATPSKNISTVNSHSSWWE